LGQPEFAHHIGEPEPVFGGGGEQFDHIEHARGGWRRRNGLTSFRSAS
jgi:hypothetical protein